MNAEEFVLVIFLGCISLCISWMVVSERRRQKRVDNKKKRHLKVVK